MHLGNFIGYILIAFFLGTAIGIERQWHQPMAGLRTNALVSVGSALFASLACLMIGESSPTRMAAQVVSGIGFLGAGLILREGNHVRGLNTAATVWCSAAVGTLCGSGFPIHAVCGTIAVISANVILRPISLRIAMKSADELSDLETHYLLKIICSKDNGDRARALLMNAMLRAACILKSLSSKDLPDSQQIQILAEVVAPGRDDHTMETIVSELGIDSDIDTVSWDIHPKSSAGE